MMRAVAAFLVPVLLGGMTSLTATFSEDATQEETHDEMCRRLEASLHTLLHGEDDERLAIAGAADEVFENLEDDPCSDIVREAVDRLIGTDPDAFLVFRLLHQWPETGDARVEPFLRGLEREGADVRRAAAEALWMSGSAPEGNDARRLLRAWRREEDGDVRRALVHVLGKMEGDEPQVELLLAARSEDHAEAAAALHELWRLESPSLFLESWRRPEPDVRAAALTWLGRHVLDPAVLEVLLEAAAGDASLREQAVRGLTSADDPRATEAWWSYVVDPAIPYEKRSEMAQEAPAREPWQSALRELVEASLPIENGLRTTATLQLARSREVVKLHCGTHFGRRAIIGKLRPASGHDSVRCHARPDRPSGILRDRLPAGLEVHALLTWQEGSTRWLGVQPFDVPQDVGDACWIEEERLAEDAAAGTSGWLEADVAPEVARAALPAISAGRMELFDGDALVVGIRVRPDAWGVLGPAIRDAWAAGTQARVSWILRLAEFAGQESARLRAVAEAHH